MAAAGLVAVAAAAEYSCPGASGGNLSAVNCGPNSGAGPGPGPGSWSRSLDRALEEAAVTGVLSLSGRKLREFPRGAANHDLTDTTRAGEWGGGHPRGQEAPGAVGGRRGRSGESRVVTVTGPVTPGREIFKIHKYLIQLNNQKTEQSDLNSAEDPNRPCSKENM